MAFMTGEIDSASKDIEYTAVNMLSPQLYEILIHPFGVFIFQFLDRLIFSRICHNITYKNNRINNGTGKFNREELQ